MSKSSKSSRVRNWTPKQLPDLSGRRYVITGGNSGIGYEAARILGEAGADVTLACRSPEKAEKARQQLEPIVKGKVDVVELDLTDLSSIRAAAETIRGQMDSLDALINNAGIMQTPERKTKDGFELQFGTNHLGHFLLTSLLMDLVESAEGRVVQIASIAHKFGRIHLDNLMLEGAYEPSKAYGQSKLANMLFAFELDRRLEATGANSIALAAHPGYSATELQSTGPEGLLNFIYKFTNALMAQPAAKGAIPTVLAAAGTEAQRRGYYGPTGFGEAVGPVGNAQISRAAKDENVAKALWEKSEDLLGEKFRLPA